MDEKSNNEVFAGHGNVSWRQFDTNLIAEILF